jgi:hypothetical protein
VPVNRDPTCFLEPFFKPVKSHYHNKNIDEAQIREDGNKVDVELLVSFEFFNVDTRMVVSMTGVRQGRATHVFSPDSVEALAPKKYASIALRLP